MELKQVIETRQSVRHFADEAVADETIVELCRLASLAPSPNNSQPWRFIAIKSRELLTEMKSLVLEAVEKLPIDAESEQGALVKKKVSHFASFFADAPLCIAVLLAPYPAVIDSALAAGDVTPQTINTMRGQPDLQSVGAAVQNLLLAATDQGLGGCWLSAPLIARVALETCLGVEEPYRLATLVALGKPAGPLPKRADKKSVDELVEIRS